VISILKNILVFVKDTFFVKPRNLPPREADHDHQINELIALINHERNINGFMPLDEIHELNVVAQDGANFNYQYCDFTTKPKGITLQFRLMKLEYPVNHSGEIVVSMCTSAQEAFNKMKIDLNAREVMKNGYFCHIGVGKCGSIWSAVFAQPRY
jgi:hypothetical protein